ncbi:MAG TPA: hypothetical protein VGU71_10610 [Candidatus Dormibacteraeota bacterium]|nr:hypothetical protein [Candidatus Dormibacteraeota bacterium]
MATKIPPPIARRTNIATAMIAGIIQEGRPDDPRSTGRRATPDFLSGGVVPGADSPTPAGTNVGRSELEAGVQVGSAGRDRGAGVTGSKYGAWGGSGSL